MKLVFFVGTAGTGKSYISKLLSQHFSWAYLDMDTVGTPFANKMLAMNGLDPDDRDSSFYKEHIRNLPYQAVVDVAMENLEAHQSAALIGPFTRELADSEWIEHTLQEKGFSLQDVDVKVVIVEVNNPDVERERIQERGYSRDQWKLEHWQDYKKEKKEYQVTWNIPDSSVIRFDNSKAMTEERLQKLIDFINN